MPTRQPVKRIALLATLACCTTFLGCAGLVARPLPPKVQVESVRTIVGANGDTRFRVRLDVQNPNAFEVAVQNIEATVRVEDQPIATANLADPVVLAASGDSKVEIEARPDFNALANAFDRILRRLAVRYQVTGYALVQDGMRLDFSKRGELPLSDFVGRLR